ncbi:MAG: NUDIX hydrolase [Candidatus Rokubacteria bacterium]|nr:NUDIX hydrolase [Candidatus Rokubacteria bacterium]
MTSPRPVAPSPAATLVLLRGRPEGGVEILLIQRHQASKFAGGDFVFPGGKIEADDMPDDAPARCVGLAPDEATRRLVNAGSAREALGFWAGAIREAFEEAGILLAYGPGGSLVDFSRSGERFQAYRRDCLADGSVFWRMLREERLTLATDRLVYFAHWITPEENPIRFDTRFFVAEAPPRQEATADEREIVSVRWMTVADALEALRRGEISLRFPTIKNLKLLKGPSAAAVLASLNGRAVPTIRPRVLGEGATRRVLLPGDAGWY